MWHRTARRRTALRWCCRSRRWGATGAAKRCLHAPPTPRLCSAGCSPSACRCDRAPIAHAAAFSYAC
eukprot:3935803-Rhodomonas_salina.3